MHQAGTDMAVYKLVDSEDRDACDRLIGYHLRTVESTLGNSIRLGEMLQCIRQGLSVHARGIAK